MIGLRDILITCRCKRKSLHKPFLLESADITRIRDLLTEQCEFCRLERQRRMRNRLRPARASIAHHFARFRQEQAAC